MIYESFSKTSIINQAFVLVSLVSWAQRAERGRSPAENINIIILIKYLLYQADKGQSIGVKVRRRNNKRGLSIAIAQ